MPKTNNVSSSSSNKPQNSLIFIFTYFKKLNIFIKLTIIFIIIPIIIYSSYPYLSYLYLMYINFLNSNIFKLKLLVCLIDVLIILYNIIELYLIQKYSKLTEIPTLYKYIPSVISNKIISIYNISQFCDNDKSIIIGYILKSIMFYILLLIIVLIILII